MLDNNLYLNCIYFANRIKALLLVHKRDGNLEERDRAGEGGE
jgi:hypothetical protein